MIRGTGAIQPHCASKPFPCWSLRLLALLTLNTHKGLCPQLRWTPAAGGFVLAAYNAEPVRTESQSRVCWLPLFRALSSGRLTLNWLLIQSVDHLVSFTRFCLHQNCVAELVAAHSGVAGVRHNEVRTKLQTFEEQSIFSFFSGCIHCDTQIVDHEL